MKLLIAVLFCLLMILPQTGTADTTQLVWGTKEYKNLNIICTPPDINKKVVPKVLDRIGKFLDTYKEEFLDTHLRKIIICKELIRHDIKWYRGTYDYDTKAIFAEVGDATHNDTNYVLHHELSSLVFIDYFTAKHKEEWEKNTFFTYDHSFDFVATYQENWIPNENLQSKGAFWRYSMTNMENDFNMIAGFRFGTGLYYDLEGAAKKHPTIANKKRIVEQIYKTFLR